MNDTASGPAQKTPRRKFLKVVWSALGLLAVGELIFMVFSFFRPVSKKKSKGGISGVVDAGTTENYAPGTVTAFVRGQFYLVCLENGGFLALSGKCTHLGCAVPWDKDKQKFICPCHSSEFDISGNVLSSPAPRAMDLFEVQITHKKISVDTAKRIQRNRFKSSQPVYPQTVVLEKGTGRAK